MAAPAKRFCTQCGLVGEHAHDSYAGPYCAECGYLRTHDRGCKADPNRTAPGAPPLELFAADEPETELADTDVILVEAP